MSCHFRIVLLSLFSFLLLALTGCEDPKKTAARKKAAAEAAQLKLFEEDAITEVKQTKTARGMTVQKYLDFFVKNNNKAFAKAGLKFKAVPSWYATCTKTGMCQVKLSVQSGKDSVEAWWLVQKKNVQPQNAMARGFQQLGYKPPAARKPIGKPGARGPIVPSKNTGKPAATPGQAPLIAPR